MELCCILVITLKVIPWKLLLKLNLYVRYQYHFLFQYEFEKAVHASSYVALTQDRAALRLQDVLLCQLRSCSRCHQVSSRSSSQYTQQRLKDAFLGHHYEFFQNSQIHFLAAL